MFSLMLWALSVLIGGLVIGGLGRLVLAGHNPIGLGWTALCGIGGSLIGGLVGRAVFRHGGVGWLLCLALEVVAASTLVALVSNRRHRHLA